MKVGELRQRITIESLTETPDGGTSLTQSFPDLVSTWAKVEDIRGVVKFGATQIDPESTHLFTIRYYPGITTEDFILFDGRRFRIRAVSDRFERGRFLALEAQEAFDEGTFD